MRHTLSTVVDALAMSSVNVEWSADAIAQEWQRLVGKNQAWMGAVSAQLVNQFDERPSKLSVVSQLMELREIRTAYRKSKYLRSVAWSDAVPVFDSRLPGEILAAANVAEVSTSDELARLLDVSGDTLVQFADHSRFNQLSHNHYRFRWSRKRRMGVRLIEAPKFGLKTLQRRLLHRLLSRIPSHDSAHGFRRGRSTVSTARPHVDCALVIRIDLEDFFTSVTGAHVLAIFRTIGYPENVAQTLTRLCTSRMPRQILRNCPVELDLSKRDRLFRWHLPQGAPTSPALANLAAYRLDRRLKGFSRSHLGRYTRYADDLIFSGGPRLASNVRRFIDGVTAIAADEGFSVNVRKTRVMRPALRQSICGVTVNERVNSSRSDFKRLKAVLHNCWAHGPQSQNRENCENFRESLRGQISYHASVNAERGAKLLQWFDRIEWE